MIIAAATRRLKNFDPAKMPLGTTRQQSQK